MNQALTEQIQAAHHLGKDLGRHQEAYHELIRIARSTDRFDVIAECLHQAGVYAGNAGHHDQALTLFAKAQEYTTERLVLGNLMRDSARSMAALGDTEKAISLVESALDMHSGQTLEFAKDLGFRGRIRSELGFASRNAELKKQGRADMERADQILGSRELNPNDPEAELYNKVHLAYWYSRDGYSSNSRRTAEAARQLMREFGIGNYQHRRRLQLLLFPLIGGWRLERTALALRSFSRKLRP